MTVGRVLGSSLAGVVKQFELDGDEVVSLARLAEVMDELGLDSQPQHVAYQLQRSGWFGSLRAQGAWEFLPAARGGAFSSGDRFLEFKALKALDSSWPGVLAMESTASLLGLAQRLPEREVVALPKGVAFPKSLVGEWRYVRIPMSKEGVTKINGLSAWNVEGLFVGIAERPSSCRDVAGLGQWLAQFSLPVDVDVVLSLLQGRTRTVQQRAAFLLKLAGVDEGAHAVVDVFPPKNPAWFGPRDERGVFDSQTIVNDAILYRYLPAGIAA